jgi:hypothetical protein
MTKKGCSWTYLTVMMALKVHRSKKMAEEKRLLTMTELGEHLEVSRWPSGTGLENGDCPISRSGIERDLSLKM